MWMGAGGAGRGGGIRLLGTDRRPWDLTWQVHWEELLPRIWDVDPVGGAGYAPSLLFLPNSELLATTPLFPIRKGRQQLV